jgi:hypothetical protein
MSAFKLLIPFGALGLAGFAVIHAAPRSFRVELAYVGYVGLVESRDCTSRVNLQGYDSLIGTVEGIENPAEPEEDVVYTGRLKRKTMIDYCETKPKSPGTPDELVWCSARLTGAVDMNVELTVYGEDGNGAWLKAKPAGPPDSLKVQGDCLQADMDTIMARYPGGESAGSPDGQPIAESSAARFQVQGVRRLPQSSTYFAPKRPETAWGLTVKGATP